MCLAEEFYVILRNLKRNDLVQWHKWHIVAYLVILTILWIISNPFLSVCKIGITILLFDLTYSYIHRI